MNSLHYGIASHPRLGYVLFWKRLLGQWSFYIKQKFGENFPTINDLHAMLQSNNYLYLMSKIQYYAKNIVGANSYWYLVKQQLKRHCNIIVLRKSSIFFFFFFTRSCVQLHWLEFHALIGDASNDYLHYKSNGINNPHILDCFFIEKTEAFRKH